MNLNQNKLKLNSYMIKFKSKIILKNLHTTKFKPKLLKF